MTAPLRRWHLRAWVALAILIPLVFVAGLIARRLTTPPNPAVTWEQGR